MLTNVTPQVADLGRRTPAELRADPASGTGADVVISRAVDDPASLLPLAVPLLKPAGRLVLMTGTRSAAAESAPTNPATVDPDGDYLVSAVHELAIPGLERTHEVTIIERAN